MGERTLYEDRDDPGLIHRDGVPEWEADPYDTPYNNLRRLVDMVPKASNRAYEEFAFRYIPALGPDSTRRALKKVREDREASPFIDTEGEGP